MAAVDRVPDTGPSNTGHDPISAESEGGIVCVWVNGVCVLDEVGGVAQVETLGEAPDYVVKQRIALAGGVRRLGWSKLLGLEVVAGGEGHSATQSP